MTILLDLLKKNKTHPEFEYDIIKKLMFIKHDQIGELLHYLCNQRTITAKYWALYSNSIIQNAVKYNAEYKRYDNQNNCIAEVIYDSAYNLFILNIISVHETAFYLALIDDYMFIPINYKLYRKPNNYALLVFDKKRSAVHLIDPNGYSNYYNKQLQNMNTQYFIEKIIEKYVFELNKYGCVYRFVGFNLWNSFNYEIYSKISCQPEIKHGYGIVFLLYYAVQLIATKISANNMFIKLCHLDDMKNTLNEFAKKIDAHLDNYEKLKNPNN